MSAKILSQLEIDLATWFTLDQRVKDLKAQEIALRRKIFKEVFPTPVEGTNSFSLEDGYTVKATHKIDRKVDLAAYNILLPKMREQKLPVDILVRWQPDLVVAQYRKLDEEALHLFDQALIIKPSETPALDIVLPAKNKK